MSKLTFKKYPVVETAAELVKMVNGNTETVIKIDNYLSKAVPRFKKEKIEIGSLTFIKGVHGGVIIQANFKSTLGGVINNWLGYA